MRTVRRPQQSLQVRALQGEIVLVDEAGRVVWEDTDERRKVLRLFEFSMARDAIAALDETSTLLERAPGRQPQYAAAEDRVIANNRLIVAKSLPRPDELRALVERDRQLDMWGRAA